MAMSDLEKIRAVTLGAKTQFKKKVFNYNGVDVEFRQPNLKERKVLLNKAKDAKGDFDLTEFLVWSVITNTYVPGTNQKVFTPEDYDAMMEQNGGSFVEVFGNEIAALMSAEDEDVKK